jgi:hypothetical protein
MAEVRFYAQALFDFSLFINPILHLLLANNIIILSSTLGACRVKEAVNSFAAVDSNPHAAGNQTLLVRSYSNLLASFCTMR